MQNLEPYNAKFWMPDMIKNFRCMARQMNCKGNTALFWFGDASDCVYFIEEGFVKVCNHTARGETINLLVHKPGDLVGIGGVVDNTERRVCAETISPCKLWIISKEVFNEMLIEYPRLSGWVIYDLADRMRRMDQTVFRIVSMDAECRLALVLLDFIDSAADISHNNPFVLRITQQEISDIIGTCRQTTTALLGKFKKAGILNTKNRAVEIYNVEKLKEMTQRSKR